MPEPLRYGHWQVADGLPRRTRPAAVYCQPSLKHANAYLEMTLTPEGLEPTLVEGAPDVAVELQALAAQAHSHTCNTRYELTSLLEFLCMSLLYMHLSLPCSKPYPTGWRGHNQPETHLPRVRWCCEHSLYQ